MSAEDSSKSLPGTRVLAIASQVSYGYVGNSMVVPVLQSLGCEVSAIHTVHYSNHTAYKQVKGTKTTAPQLLELYQGLKQSLLDDFDVLISGYMPSVEVVEVVGTIVRELKRKTESKPGSFFWVLDPVMGDAGQFYVPKEELSIYQSLLHDADVILPNQFEAEMLSGVKITSEETLLEAVGTLHRKYGIPHVVLTSLRLQQYRLAEEPKEEEEEEEHEEMITVIGSTARSDHSPRIFRIDFPAIALFFSGTGDMFAALLTARLREEAAAAAQVGGVGGLLEVNGWRSPDAVPTMELPLRKAMEKVVASVQAVLGKTWDAYKAEKEILDAEDGLDVVAKTGSLNDGEELVEGMTVEKRKYLRLMKAAEVRIIGNREYLVNPPDEMHYEAAEIKKKIPTAEASSPP